MNHGLIARDLNEAIPLPVVVKRIKAAVAQVSSGWIEAEINKVTQAKSGHYWLELAGGEDTLDGVMWRRDAERVVRDLPEPLAKGQKIHARFDRVDFYGPHGALRIVISNVRFVGEGELLRRRKESLQRLQREGLCDRKRPLPGIPRCIGLIAGRESEGQFDVVDAIRERWPPARIKIVPSLVQGARAPEQLVRSLLTLDADPEVDVIAICRGGGSVQDLLAFDDEELCRIIANTETPVVAAIGHARNRPNSYYVADAEAAVPRAAAELLVPAESDHRQLFDRAGLILDLQYEQAGARFSMLETLGKRLQRFFGVEAELSRLRTLDLQLLARGGERLRSSATALATSRQAIETAWRWLPRKDSLAAPKARLLAAAERRLQSVDAELIRAGGLIPIALDRVPAPSSLDRQAARLDRAAHRNYEEQRSHVTRLADSLAGDALRARQSAGSATEKVDSAAARLGSTVDRALRQFRQNHDGKARLLMDAAHGRHRALGDAIDVRLRQIAALDPSARGFALLRTQTGTIVDSASALHAGQAIHLELHDGSAEGHIDQVMTSKEEQ
jgi:exodeoxyribonuclease VII large subunit